MNEWKGTRTTNVSCCLLCDTEHHVDNYVIVYSVRPSVVKTGREKERAIVLWMRYFRIVSRSWH
jgi:hypothetical protein